MLVISGEHQWHTFRSQTASKHTLARFKNFREVNSESVNRLTLTLMDSESPCQYQGNLHPCQRASTHGHLSLLVHVSQSRVRRPDCRT